MSFTHKVRQELKNFGFRSNLRAEIDALGIDLTICQLIVVLLSISSVVFLFMPLFYLQDPWFVVFFFGLSIVCLFAGVWFWVHRAEICEHPEDYQ
ncbi:MAG: hypothetical protein UV61_C0009G0054 [Candidatus Gottesmanbacteria bacterium GW2011_GWB1_43_11]|uniref:Uncharacterized protein n=1 Tax=Candidatus Gottesmanbacteria bacterium GW2011_GWB1_43_11 TaxID=1618446 RepID=A0A0G1CLZ1_9BACT|nr:MAG: hypothetical protein UV17_C0031G0026 [Candidatus Gottesmanbacteria bacterium GW2011_GWA1_42_26]KKS80894.1 MAG: hypothetical protein UV55_C0026G0004 [Candidatus Gottesmanbacteria bacterium GW2011_GWC1_43_10]KKS86527.1 MAG: hypothetical protein UV61_C0009G0054 [Candidatus Gottesmanbacteria bacterium GW2011_GWB1_43_11]OGG08745.1 MAG: hypothetical protein A2699_06540 [Candidatus Gottesmanbacteria bacterium RIFCSPHIGHO2_01_FULL_43_15]HCM38086.1 hypothetical protein [Patescibacteria group bac